MKKEELQEWRHAWTLMRIPFGIYLMPIYFFALSVLPGFSIFKAIKVFVVLHLFLYPASSGYNSLCDRDETPVGGLEHPPPVNGKLKWLVWIFDLLTVLSAWMMNHVFAVLCLIILLVSKAYSYPGIRLKKYPLAGTAAVTLFQGSCTYFTVHAGMDISLREIFSTGNCFYSLVSTFFLLGSYPMTQVYQHTSDRMHGDKTLSMVLGINGTFVFTAMAFSLASVLLTVLYLEAHQWKAVVIYVAAILPILFYFFSWWLKWKKDILAVDYSHTMKLNLVSTLFLSLAFIGIMVLKR